MEKMNLRQEVDAIFQDTTLSVDQKLEKLKNRQNELSNLMTARDENMQPDQSNEIAEAYRKTVDYQRQLTQTSD